MTAPDVDQVEVTDPTHPLYGLTFPCLGITTKQRLGRVCIVWLAPGIERLIPLAATNLAVASSPPACRLCLAALQTLLAVLTSVQETPSAPTSQPQEEAPHGHDPRTASEAADLTDAPASSTIGPAPLALGGASRGSAPAAHANDEAIGIPLHQVWTQLSPTQQRQVRRALLHVLQEVLYDPAHQS